MKDKTLMVIAVAVVLVTAIVVAVASNMDLKIMSTSDFVLISPDDGSTFTGSPTFSFTVNKQTTNPVTELRVMSSDGAWTMEWSKTGDFTYTFSSLPDGNYTWYVILWSLSGSTYTRVGISETRTFTVAKSENQHYLSVRIIPSGGGNVYLNPSGGVYNNGTSVAITAIPYEGWTFDHWEGDITGSSSSVTITMDSDKSITAYFVEIQPDQFTLTLASDPPEGGTITATPSGGTYDAGTVVTLTAIPNNGYAFKGWTGTSITDKSSLTTTVTINSDMTVTAHFEKTGAHLPWWWLFPMILILLIAGIGMMVYNERRKNE